MAHNDEYMGDINENDISDGQFNMDNVSMGKKQMPVKMNLRKQEVNINNYFNKKIKNKYKTMIEKLI